MAYIKTIWENLPSENTPINASNLNKIENGIYNNSLKADQVGDLTNLTTTEKSNLVGAINENNSQITSLNTYSTTEQVIGTWIDNKHRYRAVYSGTNVSVNTSNTTILANFLQNQDNIISISSVVELGNYPYPGNTINWNTLLSPSGDLIMVAFETSRTFNKVNVIVEYTKTTD